MSRRVVFLVIILFVVMLSVFLMLFPINLDVNKEVAAKVYVEGEVASETTISIQGKISRRLFSEMQNYTGFFQIACYERSCMEGAEAKIEWQDSECQYIKYFYAGNSSWLDIAKITIDEDMDEIGILFNDGTIVATSESYYSYCRN